MTISFKFNHYLDNEYKNTKKKTVFKFTRWQNYSKQYNWYSKHSMLFILIVCLSFS